jgi:hypothetical protein
MPKILATWKVKLGRSKFKASPDQNNNNKNNKHMRLQSQQKRQGRVAHTFMAAMEEA